MRKKNLKRATSAVLAVAVVASSMFSGMTAFASDSIAPTGDKARNKAQPHFSGYRVKDIQNWDQETDPYSDLLRARIPLQERNAAFKPTQANPTLDSKSQVMLMQGDYGNSFFDSMIYNNDFSEHVLNFWQYADYYCPWHGAATAYTPSALYDPATSQWQSRGFEFGMINIPNPAYTNAAHKNGVKSIACMYFDPSYRPGQTINDMLEKDENGNFLVVDKLVAMAEYYGYDGYFLNQEDNPNDTAALQLLMQQLTEKGMYTQYYKAFDGGMNEGRKPWLKDNTGAKVCDSIFTDYGGWSSASTSANWCTSNGYDPYEVAFLGLECNKGKLNSNVGSGAFLPGTKNLQCSIALFTPSDYYQRGLDDDIKLSGYSRPLMQTDEFQWMIAERERIFFSGAKQDPTNTDFFGGVDWSSVGAGTVTGHGVAEHTTSRSVVNGTAFSTNFNTGHGMQYFYDGQVATDEEWANINIQDILPSWQWWMDSTGNKLKVDFDYGTKYKRTSKTGTDLGVPYNSQVGAYKGGSSLVVYGDIDAQNTLHLYKTDLDVNANSKAKITFKKTSDDAVTMKLGLIFKNSPDSVVPIDIADTATAGEWVTKELDLSSYASESIAAVTLIFDGTASNYQMNVGELTITDEQGHTPATPTGLTVENVYDAKDAILQWDLGSYENVKQYNVYGTMSNGQKMYLGGIFDDQFYIKSLFDENEQVKFEVTAVGKDGSESAPAELIYDFTTKPSNIQVAEEKSAHNFFDQSANAGQLNVSWDAPQSGDFDSYELNVTIESMKSTDPQNIVYTATAEKDATSAVVNVPVYEGYSYNLSICTVKDGVKGTPISYYGRLKDTFAEPLKLSEVTLNGGSLRISNPATPDWYKLHVSAENGGSSTITRATSGLTFSSFNQWNDFISIVLEDYCGNQSAALEFNVQNGQIVNPADQLTEADIPDAALLAAVKAQAGSTKSKAEKFTGTLNIANNASITDLTGINILKSMTGLEMSNCTGVEALDKSLFAGCESLNFISFSGCSALKTVDLSGLNLEEVLCSDAEDWANLTSVDVSDNRLDLSDGTYERSLVDSLITKLGASAVAFGGQKPVAYADFSSLPAETTVAVGAPEVDMTVYLNSAKTVRGNDYISMKNEKVNGQSFLADGYDLDANLPNKTYTVKITDRAGNVSYDKVSTASNSTYTVDFIDENSTVVASTTVIVGDGGLPDPDVNVALNATILGATTVSGQAQSELPQYAFDGKETTKWCPGDSAVQSWLAFDIGTSYPIGTVKMTHAGINPSIEGTTRNTVDYNIEVLKDPNATAAQLADKDYLADNANWTVVTEVRGNSSIKTEHTIDPAVRGRYWRLHVLVGDTSDRWPSTRIYELQMFVAQNTEPADSYNVTVDNLINGTVTLDKTTAKAGETVKVTVNANEGYCLVEGSLKANGETIVNGEFVMPAENVTITAEFEKISEPSEWENIQVTVNPDKAEVMAGNTQQFNASVTGDKKGQEVSISTVAITPEQASVEAGGMVSFTAAVTGNNLTDADKTVTWTVTGAASADTSIAGGVLTVGADETASSLLVIATSDKDSSKFATVMVTVTAKGGETGGSVMDGASIVTGECSGVDMSTVSTLIDGDLVSKSVGQPNMADASQAVIVFTLPEARNVSAWDIYGARNNEDLPFGAKACTLYYWNGTQYVSMGSVDEINADSGVREADPQAFRVNLSQSVSAQKFKLVITDWWVKNGRVDWKAIWDVVLYGEAPQSTSAIILAANHVMALAENIEVPSQEVVWSVEGAQSENTSIDANGLLTVGADETAVSLTVKATSVLDENAVGSASVTVTHPVITYTITIDSMENGSVTTDKATAEAGETVNVTVNADEGYRLVEGSLKANGVAIVNGQFTMPAENVTITAEFELIPATTYSITIDSMANGSVTADKAAAEAGETVNVTVNADEGYRLVEGSLKANGVAIVNGEFTMPAEDVTITAEFELIPATTYTITVDSMANGSVTADKATAEAGETVNVTVNADEGYRLVEGSLKANGVAIVNGQFTMPAENVTITAEFELIPATTYSITIDSMANGSVTADKATAEAGEAIKVTVVPDNGYRLVEGSLKANGAAIVNGEFTMPAEDVIVTAEFEKIPSSQVVTTILEMIIEEAERLKETGALDNTMQAVVDEFNAALEAGKALAADPGDATQADVNAATKRILDAIAKVEWKQGDKTNLEIAVEIARVIYANIDLYVEMGKQEFLDAFAEAEALLASGNAWQEDIDASTTRLTKAMAALRMAPNKDILNDMIANAKAMDLSVYTEKTANAVRTALAAAQLIAADPNASQDAVDAAADTLNAALKGLTYINGNANDGTVPSDNTHANTTIPTGDGSKPTKTGDAGVTGLAVLALLSAAGVALVIKKRK